MNTLSLLFASFLSLPWPPSLHDPNGCEDWEHLSKSSSAQYAWGDAAEAVTARRHGHRGARSEGRWPVELLSIGHTIASYQNYWQKRAARIPQTPYFHGGLDMRANAGSNIVASRGGKVMNLENYVVGDPAYWEIAILDDDGYLWQYHHVERSSIPQAIVTAAKNHSRVAEGALLGKVYRWSVSTFGERYNHIHVNVLAKDKRILSPFLFLESLDDDAEPRIVKIGLLNNRKPITGNETSANYSLYAEVSDLILHERFLVPPNSTTLRVDNGPLQTVWEFSDLPGGTDETKYVHDFFVVPPSCGDYQCRRIVVDLGFQPGSRRKFPTGAGTHKVEVTVADDAGNQATSTYSYRVR